MNSTAPRPRAACPAVAPRRRQYSGWKTSGVQSSATPLSATIPAPDLSPTGLLEKADQALYQAKRSGRDCVKPAAGYERAPSKPGHLQAAVLGSAILAGVGEASAG